MEYYLNIGSNLGNRALNLSRAIGAVEREFGYIEASQAVESRPWGFVSPNTFLNIGVKIISGLHPLEVLDKLQAIECSLCPESHRNPDGSYADRTVDIDIMATSGGTFSHPRLTLPHPQLTSRRFFLEPLVSLAPSWTHPATGLTAAEILRNLPE